MARKEVPDSERRRVERIWQRLTAAKPDDLTLTALACETGLDYERVKKYFEHPKKQPAFVVVAEIARVLGVDLDELDTETREPWPVHVARIKP